MDYSIAMDRLRPGAHYHEAKDYASLAAAFADVKRGAAAANAALGYTMPSDAELIAAYADWQADEAKAPDEKLPDPTGKDPSASKLLLALDAGTASPEDVQKALAHCLRRLA